MQIQDKKPDNVKELYEYWEALPNKKNPSAINADRSASDKANVQRALKDFSLGYQNTEDISNIHSSLLGDDIAKIQATLMRGMEQRLGQKPKNQYASSIRSRMNGFLRDLSDLFQVRDMQPKPGKHLWENYRKSAPRFSRKKWPVRLVAEFQSLKATMQDEYYVGPGQEHLLEWRLRLSSLETYARGVNRLVQYMMEVEGLKDFGLKDLTDYDRVQRYRRHYLGNRQKGGQNAFNVLASAVAAIARYLTIIGEVSCPYEPFSKDKNAPWIKLYHLGTHTLKQGRDTGKTDPLEPKKSLTIEQILDGANLIWKTKPRTWAYEENNYQVFRWRMAAIIFRLMTVMPVREENWVNMKWGENLRRNADGCWEIYFRSHELKNGQSGKLPREYHTVFPEFVTVWIEQWREVLLGMLGTDFEERCLYVFPACSRKRGINKELHWVRMRNNSFYLLVRDVSMEIFNQRYSPHRFRHDIATAALMKSGAGIVDATQVAHLLGDTLETVMQNYFKPNSQEKLNNDYFSDLAKKVTP